ncbi:uncharacterized protein LOC134279670 [Saccostrea cucullata]|uniref:uncharacterized protein LOC134279670 n=1 Tax=Saccostrea cuccullata TaxID=36930 RepID=UPI002ED68C98
MAKFHARPGSRRSADIAQQRPTLRRLYTSSSCSNLYCAPEREFGKRMDELMQKIRNDVLFHGPNHLLRMEICIDKVYEFYLEILENINRLENRYSSSSSSSYEEFIQPAYDDEIKGHISSRNTNRNESRLSQVGRRVESRISRHLTNDHIYETLMPGVPERTHNSGSWQYNQEQSELNDSPELLKFANILGIKDLCATEDSIYISDGSNCVTCYSLQYGRPEQMILTKNADFISMSSEALYVTNGRLKEVIKFKNDVITVIYRSHEWTPNGLAMWGDNKIYICMFNQKAMMGRVVLFKNYKGNKLVVEKEIEYKHNNTRMFRYPKFIAINSKGEPCVSDIYEKCVIVVNKYRGIRFKYDGACPDKRQQFEPEGLSCDGIDNIYVTDNNNDCVDIVNPGGYRLKSIYDIPSPVCVTFSDNILYVTMKDKQFKRFVRVIRI